jgi:hypothetical protein
LIQKIIIRSIRPEREGNGSRERRIGRLQGVGWIGARRVKCSPEQSNNHPGVSDPGAEDSGVLAIPGERAYL